MLIAVTIQPRHTGLQQGQDEPIRVQKTTQMHTKTQIRTEKKALINLEHDRAEHSSPIKIIRRFKKCFMYKQCKPQQFKWHNGCHLSDI